MEEDCLWMKIQYIEWFKKSIDIDIDIRIIHSLIPTFYPFCTQIRHLENIPLSLKQSEIHRHSQRHLGKFLFLLHKWLGIVSYAPANPWIHPWLTHDNWHSFRRSLLSEMMKYEIRNPNVTGRSSNLVPIWWNNEKSDDKNHSTQWRINERCDRTGQDRIGLDCRLRLRGASCVD